MDPNGLAITGPVQVFLREFYSRKDIVLSGVNTNSYSQMLVTGGAIELRAELNGSPLDLDPSASIAVAFPGKTDVNGYENQMQQFVSDDDPLKPAQGFNWRMGNERPARVDTTNGSLGFILNDVQLGYTNCDALYAIPSNDRTQFEVIVSGDDGGETQVFMLVKDLSTVINLYTRNGPAYTTYAGSVPMGLEATLVAISVVNGQLHYGSKKITVAGNDNFTVAVNPGTTSGLENLLEFPF
ncbi:MAG: hypothetical protein R3B47_00175 [Bacteroidia bacterium]